MTYAIVILRRAQKELADLPENSYPRVRDTIRDLAQEPKPAGSRKLVGREGWRIRVGTYRCALPRHHRQEDLPEAVTLGWLPAAAPHDDSCLDLGNRRLGVMGNGGAGWRQPRPRGASRLMGALLPAVTSVCRDSGSRFGLQVCESRCVKIVRSALRTGHGLSRLPDLGFARTCVSAFQGYTE